MAGYRFPSDKVIAAKWPKGTVVWTSVTTDVQVASTGEPLKGVFRGKPVYRIVVGANWVSGPYLDVERAVYEAVAYEMTAERAARQK